MIELTRLNGNPLVINSDLIKYAEAAPDTMLTLINGEKIMVRESCSEVVERVLVYRSRLLSEVARLSPDACNLRQAASIAAAAGSSLAANFPSDPNPNTENLGLDPETVQRRRRPEY